MLLFPYFLIKDFTPKNSNANENTIIAMTPTMSKNVTRLEMNERLGRSRRAKPANIHARYKNTIGFICTPP